LRTQEIEMAREENVVSIGTMTAAADLSAKQGYWVYGSAANAVNVAAVGSRALGILRNKPTSGLVADVQVGGITKALAGAAIGAMKLVAPDATGRSREATSPDLARGIALEATSAAGEWFSCFLLGPESVDTLDLVAAADHTGKTGYLVKVDTAGKFALAGNGGVFSAALETVGNAVKESGRFRGVANVYVAGTVTAGDAVASDANGTGKTATAGDYAGGTALETGTATTIKVLMVPPLPLTAGRMVVIPFTYWETVSTGGVCGLGKLPFKCTLKEGECVEQTAPGSGKATTISITDGATAKTFTVDGTAKTGSKTDFTQEYASGATMTISISDDGAGAKAAGFFRFVETP
jgi:hypothetical protein